MACSTLARSSSTLAGRTAFRAAMPSRVRLVVRASSSQDNLLTRALPSLAKPALVTLTANVIMAMPAAAEAGKLFDFNLTLPIMAGQFLLLMVFLDKFWFGPVGKVLDERDSLIREKLGSVKDNSGELSKLTAEAEGIIKEARAEVTAMVNSQKQAKQAELDKIYAAAKEKVTAEVEAGIAAVEKESEGMLAKLDAQVDKISNEVLRSVLPEGVKV